MKKKDKQLERNFSNFFKSAIDIFYKPQTTIRRIKGKLIGRTHIWDRVKVSDSVTVKAWNLKNKVIYKINPETGEKEEIPMTKEQVKEFTRMEEEENNGE